MAQSFHYPDKPERPAPSSQNDPPIKTAKEARDGSKGGGRRA